MFIRRGRYKRAVGIVTLRRSVEKSQYFKEPDSMILQTAK